MTITKKSPKQVTSVRFSTDTREKLEKMLNAYQDFAQEQAEAFGMITPKITVNQIIETSIKKEYERLEKEGRI
ncbi:hypothetical protein P4K71_26465 [Bacillus cereus]|uniref:hypothetical protein n=1 Tax=Bacillus cereus TaxID=1396 RepID=UPI002DBC3781|nr:hypothetical protein [Bacillus cereus]MEB8909571.1 hypothetical protein [Bacillus cereus]MEB9926288.1 hypothetical protein [Bacillus cereus]MEB9986877.1 hypothetical protein [Bacillus cereus]MEB9992071.1 hypothetical protein [Bacillus cereus]